MICNVSLTDVLQAMMGMLVSCRIKQWVMETSLMDRKRAD
jgi:hypothetical protein